MIQALVKKDVLLFFRNRYFALLTVMGVVIYAAVYLLLPSTPDDKQPAALFIEGAADPSLTAGLAYNLEATLFDSEDALKGAVTRGDYVVGVVISADSLAALQRGEQAHIPVYYAPGTTRESSDALTDVVTVTLDHLNYSNGELNANLNEQREVLGADLSGIIKPIPFRDRLLPIFLLMLLVVETMGLATLIVQEVEQRTLRALLVTPLGTGRFFVAKAITGVGLAFLQVLLLAVITWKVTVSPFVLTVALLDGGLLVTGVGFLIASVARQMTSAITWGMLALVILGIPALAVVYPALTSDWIRLIPSYYLVDTLHRALNFGATLADVVPNLLVLLATGLSALALGSVIVRRRFQWI